MLLKPETKIIHLDHADILLACYEWLKHRGFKPNEVRTMNIKMADDLVFPNTGERRKRYELVFECDNPQGKLCWDDNSNYYVSTSKADYPWLED